MSARSRLLAEAEKHISNPFLLCVLISKRTRQFMMVGNPHANTAQMVDSALSDLIAGALEFEFGNATRLSVTPEEPSHEESAGKLGLSAVPEILPATGSLGAP
jgi:hypothetical protein